MDSSGGGGALQATCYLNNQSQGPEQSLDRSGSFTEKWPARECALVRCGRRRCAFAGRTRTGGRANVFVVVGRTNGRAVSVSVSAAGEPASQRAPGP